MYQIWYKKGALTHSKQSGFLNIGLIRISGYCAATHLLLCTNFEKSPQVLTKAAILHKVFKLWTAEMAKIGDFSSLFPYGYWQP